MAAQQLPVTVVLPASKFLQHMIKGVGWVARMEQ